MKSEGNSKDFAVSVIIPMFNVAHSIDRCLHSLAAQRMERVEYLFIDDCSTDATVSRLSAWIAERQDGVASFRLIRHESNQGVAVARNTGLNHASGKYIYYVDADDYIEPDTLQILYDEAEAEELDIAGCEWFLSFRQNERRMGQPDAANGDELFRKMAQGTMRWNLWLFLVRRSLYEAHSIRFIPRMNMGEDMMVMLKLSLHARRVRVFHTSLYHYGQTNSSSLTKNYLNSIPQITANIEETERYLRAVGRTDLCQYISLLKLSVKLPFLISSSASDYRVWLSWFPEANEHIGENATCSWRTRMLQRAARAKQFWFLRLYYWLVIKVVYGLLYK